MAKKLNLKLKKGALHRMMGVKQGKKLAPGELYKAANSKNPLERKRAQFAMNAKKWNKKGGKKKAVKRTKKMTMAQDKRMDKRRGIKEGSMRDKRQDKRNKVKD